MGSTLRTVSWILLALVGVMVLLTSMVSANLAYRGDYPVGGVSIGEIASGRDAVLEGLRGTRGTAAAWAAAWAALFLAVVFGPTAGDVATWWGISPRSSSRRGGGGPGDVPQSQAGRARPRHPRRGCRALLLDVKRIAGAR
jgi:hypothetical protein